MGAGASTEGRYAVGDDMCVTPRARSRYLQIFQRARARLLAQIKDTPRVLAPAVQPWFENRSARALGQHWRYTSTVAHLDYRPDEHNQSWGTLCETKLREVQTKKTLLAKFSLAKETMERIQKRQRELDEEAMVAAEAEERERAELSVKFHLISTQTKYFTKARSFVKVTVYMNHRRECVVSATTPDGNNLIEPIHFHERAALLQADADVANDAARNDCSEKMSIEELRAAPELCARAESALFRSNRLTVVVLEAVATVLSDTAGAAGAAPPLLNLTLLGCTEAAPARDRVDAEVLTMMLGAQTARSEGDCPIRPSRSFSEGLLQVDEAIERLSLVTDTTSEHERIANQTRKLKTMHLQDATVLDELIAGSPMQQLTMRSKKTAGLQLDDVTHRIDTRWEKGKKGRRVTSPGPRKSLTVKKTPVK